MNLNTRQTFNVAHIRHDRGHCLAPGLFRSLVSGERKKTKLDVTYNYAADCQLRFIGFEALGVDDMRFLQGLVGLGGPDGLMLSPEPQNDKPKQLRLLLDAKWDAAQKDALVVKESIYRILHEIGMTDGGENIKALKESLVRMSNVTVIARNGGKQASFHLLSYFLDEDDGRMLVALNPAITEAILGQAPYTRISMDEIRALKSDPARVIHQRLCGWIDPGTTRSIGIDTLCEYAWPTEAKPEANKRRRSKVRTALLEFAELGWTIDEYAKGKFRISRPGIDS
jgi:hypothetical protein